MLYPGDIIIFQDDIQVIAQLLPLQYLILLYISSEQILTLVSLHNLPHLLKGLEANMQNATKYDNTSQW